MSEDCNPMAVRLNREERARLQRHADKWGIGPYKLLRQIVSGALNKMDSDVWQGTLAGWAMALEMSIQSELQEESEKEQG
jgi:hypothetical protein